MKYSSTQAASTQAASTRPTLPRIASIRAASGRAILLRTALARVLYASAFRRTDAYRQSTQINLTAALIKTVSVDVGILLIGWLLSLLSTGAIAALSIPYEKANLLLPPRWLVLFVCLSLPCAWLCVDVAKALSYPQALPFVGLASLLKKVYQQRLYWLLQAFCFITTLTLLCITATETLLVFKLFISVMVAITLHFNQRLLSYRRRLLASSLIFLSLLTTNQAIITARLTASFVESIRAPLNLLNELILDPQKREFPLDDEI